MAWTKKRLGDVCNIINGKNQKDVLDINGKYPIFGSAGNVMGYANKYLCDQGTVIIGRKGNISTPIFIDEPFWNVDTAFGIYPKEKLMLPKFNYYQCLNIDFKSRNKGTTIPSLVKTDLLTIDIYTTDSIPEQQAIVEKLDFAFDAIEKAKANIEKNIENAKELFQSKLNEIFSQKGEGWEEKTLHEIILKTKNINPKEFPAKEFKYIDVSAVNRNTFLIAEYQTINSTNAPSRARKLVLKNDIIYATVRPTLTRVCIIEKEFDNQICSTGYVVLRHNEKIILPKIIFYFLLTSEFYDAMEKLQKGASYPAVTDNEIKMQIINFPTSKKEQEKIITQLDLISDQTNLLQEKYKQKLANLEELKKSILEKAFKGELV